MSGAVLCFKIDLLGDGTCDTTSNKTLTHVVVASSNQCAVPFINSADHPRKCIKFRQNATINKIVNMFTTIINNLYIHSSTAPIRKWRYYIFYDVLFCSLKNPET